MHFVCVGTPQGPDGAADLTAVQAVVDTLVPLLTRPSLVVGKSTVPVGTAEALRDRIAGLARPGVQVDLTWNPEFLREAHAVEDTLHPDRLVLGVEDPEPEWTLRSVYAAAIGAGTPVVVTDLPTAELVKVGANAFLATKTSFVNALAELCEATGADITLLADALGHDARIGRRFLDAGLGFGGGCLPKDLRALAARGAELGLSESMDVLRWADEVNQRRRDRVVQMVHEQVGDPAGLRVGVLGAVFKPGSDDVCDSPALDVARRLHELGAEVTVHDPAASATARAVAPTLGYAANPMTACRAAEGVLHLTEWPQFAAIDPTVLGRAVRRRVLIDARNTLDVERWRRAGWTVAAPGRSVDAGAPRRFAASSSSPPMASR